jgi:hypothetical protein
VAEDRILVALDSGGYLRQSPDPVGENKMFCPVCEDPAESRSPSASYNPTEQVWNCLKGEHPVTMAALRKALGVRGTAARRKVVRKKQTRREDKPVPLEDQDKPFGWHDALMRGSYPDALEFLQSERGLTDETLKRFHIGSDGQRITIPVCVNREWVNVRRYLPHAPEDRQKMLNLKGHGESRLYPLKVLRGNTLPVLLCEGELDCLLANQESEGKFVAVTGTGGASVPPRDLHRLAGREVFVAYDCDQAGRDGAEKVAASLSEFGATAHVLNLAQFEGVPADSKEDVTDFFLKHAGSAGDLVDAFEQLRAGDEPTRPAFTFLTAGQLAEPVPPMEWLVQGVWPAGSYGVLAGEKKTLKTYNLFALALSVASGEPYLGRFAVPEARPVVVFSGEGGANPGRRRLQRIAQWMDVDLARLPLSVTFDAGDMTGEAFAAALAEQVAALSPGLVIVDPLYAFHPADIDAQNLYERGRMLSGLLPMIPEGCAFVLADHFRKTGSKDLDLDSVAQAGVGQWADNWILQRHASAPQVDAGRFELAVQFAGRQWGGAQYGVSWDVGSFDVERGEHDGDLSITVNAAEWGDTGHDARQTRLEAMILHLAEQGDLRKTALEEQARERLKIGAATFRKVFDDLVQRGRLELYSRPGSKRRFVRVPPSTEGTFTIHRAGTER